MTDEEREQLDQELLNNRDAAIRFVVSVLSSRLAMMSPAKREALALVEHHKLTIPDLFGAVERSARNA